MDVPQLTPRIEGPSDGETLFFVQGWPDDASLWDEQVAALRARYRCVRVDLPNYGDAERRRWGYSHDAIVEGLARCIRQVSPQRPVTMVAHDWGAFWSYILHHRHPELVARLVGLDIGGDMNPTPREAFLILAYQGWLAAAFLSGGRLGDWMTRRFARLIDAPKQGEQVNAAMNYPYFYNWRDLLTGRLVTLLKGYSPDVPILFVYGAQKPGRFHSERWLKRVRRGRLNEVVELEDTGHWVMRDPKLNGILRSWLDRTSPA